MYFVVGDGIGVVVNVVVVVGDGAKEAPRRPSALAVVFVVVVVVVSEKEDDEVVVSVGRLTHPSSRGRRSGGDDRGDRFFYR